MKFEEIKILQKEVLTEETEGLVALGLYDGNDVEGRIIGGVSFEPRYVIVKAGDGTEGVHRPEALDGDDTLRFSNNSNLQNAILEMTADGFDVGLGHAPPGSARLDVAQIDSVALGEAAS